MTGRQNALVRIKSWHFRSQTLAALVRQSSGRQQKLSECFIIRCTCYYLPVLSPTQAQVVQMQNERIKSSMEHCATDPTITPSFGVGAGHRHALSSPPSSFAEVVVFFSLLLSSSVSQYMIITPHCIIVLTGIRYHGRRAMNNGRSPPGKLDRDERNDMI
jgi:hypothetical protein